MCGIFGAIGTDYNYNSVKLLGVINEDRGDQATGIFDGIKIAKEVYPARTFFTDRPRPTGKYILGHTRLSTSGDKNNPEHAHPYRIGKIVGAHNGIITNDKKISSYIGKRYPVDSQYIFHLLNFDTPVDAFNKLEGGFAVWWQDINDLSKVYMYRHTNPIHIYHDRDNVLYFSSEDRALKTTFGNREKEIISLKENVLYTIDVDTGSITEEPCVYKTKYNDSNKYNEYYNRSVWHGHDEGQYMYPEPDYDTLCVMCGTELSEKELERNYINGDYEQCFCNTCYKEQLEIQKNMKKVKSNKIPTCCLCHKFLTDEEAEENTLGDNVFCKGCYDVVGWRD